jgi:ABC-type glycerol-3-phosphate transport system substrate-binding protein
VAFELGNLAMAYQGVWELGAYNAAGLRWGAGPAPMRKAAVSGGHFSPLVMAQAARQKDAAWAWLAFACLSERGQGLLVDTGQMQPTRKSLESRFVDAVAPPATQYRQAFADELKGGTLRVAGDKAGSYWGGYKREWAQLWDTGLAPLFRGERPALQVAPGLRQRTELLLKQGWAPAGAP